tara:strand:- start:129 stop:353 length:225 start_codon:yes stop_codon:yes gene_type:complete
MHIDKYKIISMDYTWKNGKQSKDTSVQQEMISKECITGRTFIQLLSDLDQAWHQHGECKTCKIEVTFEPYKHGE